MAIDLCQGWVGHISPPDIRKIKEWLDVRAQGEHALRIDIARSHTHLGQFVISWKTFTDYKPEISVDFTCCNYLELLPENVEKFRKTRDPRVKEPALDLDYPDGYGLTISFAEKAYAAEFKLTFVG